MTPVADVVADAVRRICGAEGLTGTYAGYLHGGDACRVSADVCGARHDRTGVCRARLLADEVLPTIARTSIEGERDRRRGALPHCGTGDPHAAESCADGWRICSTWVRTMTVTVMRAGDIIFYMGCPYGGFP